MKIRMIQQVMVFALVLLSVSPSFADTKAQKQAKVRQKSTQILTKLYAAQPSARNAIKRAAGYATFSNFGMKILIAGGGKGT